MANFGAMVNFPQLWWERVLSVATLLLGVVYYGSLVPVIPLIAAGYLAPTKGYAMVALFVALWIALPVICCLAIQGLEKLYRHIVPN